MIFLVMREKIISLHKLGKLDWENINGNLIAIQHFTDVNVIQFWHKEF